MLATKQTNHITIIGFNIFSHFPHNSILFYFVAFKNSNESIDTETTVKLHQIENNKINQKECAADKRLFQHALASHRIHIRDVVSINARTHASTAREMIFYIINSKSPRPRHTRTHTLLNHIFGLKNRSEHFEFFVFFHDMQAYVQHFPFLLFVVGSCVAESGSRYNIPHCDYHRCDAFRRSPRLLLFFYFFFHFFPNKMLSDLV